MFVLFRFKFLNCRDFDVENSTVGSCRMDRYVARAYGRITPKRDKHFDSNEYFNCYRGPFNEIAPYQQQSPRSFLSARLTAKKKLPPGTKLRR